MLLITAKYVLNIKPRRIVGFPLGKCFSETVALDLKELTLNTWFLHTTDHLTRFSTSCVIKSKCREVFVRDIVQIWITIFGSLRITEENSIIINLFLYRKMLTFILAIQLWKLHGAMVL